MYKFKPTLISIIIAMPLLATACSDKKPESDVKPPAVSSVNSSPNVTSNTSSNGGSALASASAESVSAPAVSDTPAIPDGEPTIFTGLDGKVIYTSEITAVENTDKSAAEITDADYDATITCEGFAYVKEPLGIGYDSYRNPELFEEYNFLGDIPENKNEWKRVNVGDEICGLKVKSAAACFSVNSNEEYKFPGNYYLDTGSFCELEGTVEAEGYFQITPPNEQYPDSGELVTFYPTVINLPLMPSWQADENEGFLTTFNFQGVFDHLTDYSYMSEFTYVNLGYYSDLSDELDGLRLGDVAYARVKLGNIKINGGGSFEATLENLELLSDVLKHDEPR